MSGPVRNLTLLDKFTWWSVGRWPFRPNRFIPCYYVYDEYRHTPGKIIPAFGWQWRWFERNGLHSILHYTCADTKLRVHIEFYGNASWQRAPFELVISGENLRHIVPDPELGIRQRFLSAKNAGESATDILDKVKHILDHSAPMEDSRDYLAQITDLQ